MLVRAKYPRSTFCLETAKQVGGLFLTPMVPIRRALERVQEESFASCSRSFTCAPQALLIFDNASLIDTSQLEMALHV